MATAFDFDVGTDLKWYTDAFARNARLTVVTSIIWFVVHIGAVFFWKIFFPTVRETIIANMKIGDKKKNRERSERYYNHRASFDLYTKSVAFVHAIVSSVGAFYALYMWPAEGVHTISPYDPTPIYVYISVLSAGYFMYDFIVSVYDLDVSYILHGLMSFLIFGHSSFPFFAYYGAIFLLFEFSTIFLHIRWFLLSMNKTNTVLFKIFEPIFLVTFFGIRFLWGPIISAFYFQPKVWSLILNKPAPANFTITRALVPAPGSFVATVESLFQTLFPLAPPSNAATLMAPHSYFAAILFSLSNIGLQLLNVFWVGKMLMTRMKRTSAEKKNTTKTD